MNITDIRIFPVDEPKLKAFVSVIFDACFIVSDIKIIEGNNGFFLSMPSKKRRDGTFKDIAHPLNSEMRRMMETEVIAAYKEHMASEGRGEESSKPAAAEPAVSQAPAPETPVTEAPAPETPVAEASAPEMQQPAAPEEAIGGTGSGSLLEGTEAPAPEADVDDAPKEEKPDDPLGTFDLG